MVRKNKGSSDKSGGAYERPSESIERLGAILELADAALAKKTNRNMTVEDYPTVVREQEQVISALQAGMRALMTPGTHDLEGSIWNLAAFQLSDLSDEVSAARMAIQQLLQHKSDRHV